MDFNFLCTVYNGMCETYIIVYNRVFHILLNLPLMLPVDTMEKSRERRGSLEFTL